MISLPFELALVIDGSAMAVGLIVRAALRDRDPGASGPPLPCRFPRAATPCARAVPAGEAAGLAALISGVTTGAGITAGLWMSGQPWTAYWALVLAATAVLVAAGGYTAGLRDRRAPKPSAPPEQETVDLGAQLLAQMYGQACAPEPRRPRRGGLDGQSWFPPNPGPG